MECSSTAKGSILDSKPSKVLCISLTNNIKITLFFLLPTLVNLIVYAADIISDVTVAAKHDANNHPSWAAMTMTCVYAPALMFSCIFIFQTALSGEKTVYKLMTIVFSIASLATLPLWPIFRFLWLLYHACRALCSPASREDSLGKFLKPSSIELLYFLESFLEDAPQFLLQMYILLVQPPEMQDWVTVSLQIYSIISSLISLSAAVVSPVCYETNISESVARAITRRADRNRTVGVKEAKCSSTEQPEESQPMNGARQEEEQDTQPINGARHSQGQDLHVDLLVKITGFIWWFSFMASRIFALALFASIFKFWVFIVCIIHSLLMVIILSLKYGVKSFSEIIIYIFVGFIFIFCFIDCKVKLKELGKIWLLYCSYYVLVLMEDVMMVMSWYMKADPSLWYHHAALAAQFGAYFISVLFMMLYFCILTPHKNRKNRKGQSTNTMEITPAASQQYTDDKTES